MNEIDSLSALSTDNGERPQVIFLDAVGTLFGIRGSVGDIYSVFALQAGVNISPQQLNEAFFQSFAAASPPAFPGVAPEQIPEREFDWWAAIARSTFASVGVLDQFSDFQGFFKQLYAHFATEKPWYLYPDVLPALQGWRQQGIELGIISNFDTRLYSVIEQLQIKEFLTSVTISAHVGAAKPDRRIFEAALKKHHYTPNQAWHIGDSQKEDYDGAKQAGLKPFLLQRS